MKIKIMKLNEAAILPEYQTSGAAAMDLCACIERAVTIEPSGRVVILTGLAMSLPRGYEAQIRARSGLSLKHGIVLANGIGTIDSDYRGEVGVILANMSQEKFEVTPGMRVAQMVVAQHETVEWDETESLDATGRGGGGYGSTGR